MGDDFAARVGPVLQPLLEPGETMLGVAAATLRKTFSGGLFAVGVTDRRLLLQSLDRHLGPREPAVSLPPAALASGGVEGAGMLGGGGLIETSDIVDAVSVTVQLRTTDGRKFKLMLMKGGDGLLGGLGGGESQAEGARALVEWLRRTFPNG